jgi:serine/alanine adding enzyme
MDTPLTDRPRSLVVHDVDPLADPRWDAFVMSRPDATAFHRAAWLAVLAEEYQQPTAHLACLDADGGIVGVLPLVQTRGLPLGIAGARGLARLSSLPRTSTAGPLADGPGAAAALLTAAIEQAQDRGVHLQIKPVSPDLDGLVDGLGGLPWRSTYVLDLPQDSPDNCFDTRHRRKRLRHLVLKSEREGVQVRPGTIDDLAAWYRLYLDAMRRHVQPARPLRLFRALLDRCQGGGLGRWSVAEAGTGADRHLVGGIFCLDGTATTTYAFTGLDRRAVTLHPVDALLWEAIHHAHAAGMRHFDLGEVPDGNESLARFKLKWGTHPQPVRRYYWPSVEADDADSAAGSAPLPTRFERSWQRVPLPVTAVAGGVVHRYL